MRRRRCRLGEYVRALCGGLLLYLGSYGLLSQSGTYVPAVAAGSPRQQTGVVVDRLVWQPRYCRWYQWRSADGRLVTDSNLPGCVFLPLIAFDRARVHPTHRLFPTASEMAAADRWRRHRGG